MVTPEEQLCFDVNRFELPRLTSQEEHYVIYRLRGLSPAQAATAAGYSHAVSGYALEKKDKIQRALSHFRERQASEIKVTRDMLTRMLFEAHSHSANATEEIAAIRELGKMHGIYEQSDAPSVNVNINNIAKLERMSDKELLRLSELEIEDVSPDVHALTYEGSDER